MRGARPKTRCQPIGAATAGPGERHPARPFATERTGPQQCASRAFCSPVSRSPLPPPLPPPSPPVTTSGVPSRRRRLRPAEVTGAGDRHPLRRKRGRRTRPLDSVEFTRPPNITGANADHGPQAAPRRRRRHGHATLHLHGRSLGRRDVPTWTSPAPRRPPSAFDGLQRRRSDGGLDNTSSERAGRPTGRPARPGRVPPP